VDKVVLGRIYCSIGVASSLTNDKQQSYENFMKSYEIKKKLYGDHPHPEMAKLLDRIGYYYFKIADYKESLNYYEKSLE